MKNLSKLIVVLTLLSGQALADPSIVLKVGGWPGAASSKNAGVAHSFMYSIESNECTHCLSPFFINVSNPEGKNSGLGLDYIYKVGNEKSTFRLAAGLVGFEDPLNGGEAANFHLGAGFEIYATKKVGILVSIDHFSNGRKIFNREETVDKNVPLNLLSVGIHFN